jgi:TRAP-type C4-dicarboxylate transport system permease small subunit
MRGLALSVTVVAMVLFVLARYATPENPPGADDVPALVIVAAVIVGSWRSMRGGRTGSEDAP